MKREGRSDFIHGYTVGLIEAIAHMEKRDFDDVAKPIKTHLLRFLGCVIKNHTPSAMNEVLSGRLSNVSARCVERLGLHGFIGELFSQNFVDLLDSRTAGADRDGTVDVINELSLRVFLTCGPLTRLSLLVGK